MLRKRRTKLKLDQFHILTQVGQGGYGEVYLAKHKESHQVVALKKLRKRTLLKMDEVGRKRSYSFFVEILTTLGLFCTVDSTCAD